MKPTAEEALRCFYAECRGSMPPERPEKPPRPALKAGACFGALAAGFGLAAVLAFIAAAIPVPAPSGVSPQSLQNALGRLHEIEDRSSQERGNETGTLDILEETRWSA